MDSGSFQFQGHFCKSLIVILITKELATFHALVDLSVETVVRDVEYKLEDLKASRSPVEAEIKFIEEWLSKWPSSSSFNFTPPLSDNLLQELNEEVDKVQQEMEESHLGPFMVK